MRRWLGSAGRWIRRGSTAHYRRRHLALVTDGRVAQRPGPVGAIGDAQLVELIRTVITDSPFAGEGYRKIRARLRPRHNVRVSGKRMLRLLRREGLDCCVRIVFESPEQVLGSGKPLGYAHRTPARPPARRLLQALSAQPPPVRWPGLTCRRGLGVTVSDTTHGMSDT